MNENEIATRIVDSAYKTHVDLGPGLFESVYQEVLTKKLENVGLSVKKEIDIPITYEELSVKKAFRLDLLVNDLVIVEIKSVEVITNLHFKQLHTYLKLTECKLGLLINFNEVLIKHGIRRVVNGLEEP